MENKLLLTVSETAAALGMGRSKVYEMVRDGVIPSVKIDGCRRVKAAALRTYVDALGEAA
ncbi:MAG: helix-turn-helix domain-containing protein [Nocardioides sp.]|nr:helix-turn-helix domain-containing protein [Nocardioides sp.]